MLKSHCIDNNEKTKDAIIWTRTHILRIDKQAKPRPKTDTKISRGGFQARVRGAGFIPFLG